MERYTTKYKNWILFGLALYLFLALSNHISLAEGQLGYFIKEGALFVEEGQLAFSNIHTYTSSSFEMHNNHWLSATVFYILVDGLGFGGIHVLLALVYTFFFVQLVRYLLNWQYPIWSTIIAIFALPIFAAHTIVDPIFFSHIFTIIFFLLLHRFIIAPVAPRFIWILPFFQLLWVNTHHYFIISWGLLLLSLIEVSIRQKQKVLPLGVVALSCFLVSFLHPQFLAGLTGALELVFTQAEVLPIWWRTSLEAYLQTHSYVYLYLCLLILVILLGFGLVFITKQKVAEPVFILGSILWLTILVYWHNQLAAIVIIPFILLFRSLVSYRLVDNRSEKELLMSYQFPTLSLYLLIPVFIAAGFYKPTQNFGYGLRAEEQKVTDFLQAAQIQGPFFHNTSISGLLAYGLAPLEKLYISSQPLAHPTAFYQKEYFPYVLTPRGWKDVHDKYQFNAVVFRLKNASNQELEFMGNLLGNGRWVMVYFEKDYEVVLVKNTPTNKIIISNFGINPQKVY